MSSINIPKTGTPPSGSIGNVSSLPERLPWSAIEVPPGYELTWEGVAQVDDKANKWHKLSGPVWVDAYTRDNSNASWGMLICWLDRDGSQHQRSVPLARLHEAGPALAQELASEGLAIVPGKERRLMTYLGGFQPEARFQSVSRLGWLDNSDRTLVYVLPRQVLSGGTSPAILYQPERYSPSADTLRPSGSLDDWNYHIAGACRDNPLLVFSLCVSLGAPLLKPARMDGGGFHIYGASSRGKTTALQVAASVWGCGADPAEAPAQTSIHRWNATRNGLEGLAAAHNDGLLAMDELGSCAAEDFGRVIYDLSGGRGKAAMDANRMLKEQRSWRNLILSTGEVSALRKIEEGRKTPKAGQLLRFTDIPTDGVIMETRGRAPADFANALKRACGQYYGTAGPAFVQALVDRSGDPLELQREVTAWVDTWTDKLSPANAAPEQRRAMRRLALVLVAGLLAQDLGIVPKSLDVVSALTTVRDAWRGNDENLPEGLRGVLSVKAFLLANRDRFAAALGGTAPDARPVRDLCGYYSTKENGLYLFTDDGFREACRGYDVRTVANELANLGLLYLNESRLKSRHLVSFDGQEKRMRLYAIRTQILETDFEAESAPAGAMGTNTGIPTS